MEDGQHEPEDRAVLVVALEVFQGEEIVHIDPGRLEIPSQVTVIRCEIAVNVLLPALRGQTGAEKIAQVDGRPCVSHELQVQDSDVLYLIRGLAPM